MYYLVLTLSSFLPTGGLSGTARASSSGNLKRKPSKENLSATQVHALLRRLHANGYLQGRHHLQEIMWQEGISRKELQMVLSMYADVLVKVTHEHDPAAADRDR